MFGVYVCAACVYICITDMTGVQLSQVLSMEDTSAPDECGARAETCRARSERLRPSSLTYLSPKLLRLEESKLVNAASTFIILLVEGSEWTNLQRAETYLTLGS